jgi:TonB-dependent starch-binding outer membrane protein SusC
MRKILLLLAMVSFIGLQAFAQTTVTGTVTDPNGDPVPGANVSVKGTDAGTITDLNGSFTLNVPAGATTLVFSFVGMKTTEVEISGRSNIEFQFETEEFTFDEVVVVAYGIQRKEAGTGSVSVLKSENMAGIPTTSAEKLLQGKISGVQLNNTTGQPGSSTQIRIRGFSSITANNEPLFVIDGVPVMSGNFGYFASTGNILSTLNPNDIESMTVLKDAAAASIYGSRAANGVILITTKTGKKGQAQFKASIKYGISQIANDNNYRMMNGEEAYTYVRNGIINASYDNPALNINTVKGGFFAEETLNDTIKTVNWMDYATQIGKSQEYEFSATAGTDKSKFYASGSYFDQQGIMIETFLKRYSFRLNYESELTKQLTLGTRLQLAYTHLKDRPNNALYYVNPIAAASWNFPWEKPYNDDGSFNFDLPVSSNSNFLASAAYDHDYDRTYKNLGTIYLVFSPIEGLTIKTQNSAEYAFTEGSRWWDPRGAAPGNEDGTLQENRDKFYTLTTTNTINYAKTFAGAHNISVMVGQEAFKYRYQSVYLSAWDLGYKTPYFSNATDEKSSVSYSNSEQTFMSVFGMIDYNYKDKYLAKVSLRRDGNSRFGKDTKWANFWAVGASWNLHNESFMGNFSFVDMAKLRVSYGINGNDGIGNYTQYGNYGSSAYNGIVGVVPQRIDNPNLTWELNSTFNVGFDFAFLKRLQGSIEYYNRISSDLLLSTQISQTSGFSSYTLNVGELKNTGVETNLTVNVLKAPVILDFRLNLANNKTEILDLGGEEKFLNTDYLHYRVGGSYMDYYLYDWVGVNPANGQPLWRDADGNLTDDHSKARRYYAGQVAPNWIGGFGFDASWKGVSFSVSFDFKTGHYVYNREKRYLVGDGAYYMNSSAEALDYWKQPGDVVEYPKPYYLTNSQSSILFSDRFLQKGDFLRIKDLTLSYAFPTALINKAKLSSARIYFSGSNLYTFHNVDYWDPERGVTGYGVLPFPQSKTYIFGLEIGF